ncbi:MAG TPA: DUF4166 domain-containing protein [Hyphomicrobiaceae bacterium]|nr:DUF4166 domain-containing protein [Hyphomicrobiaceae bacterium]
MTRPLYRRVLGPAFDALPPRVRQLHDLDGTSVWEGVADVERGPSLASRLAGWLTRLPPAGSALPLRVTFEAVGDRELWSRRFGSALFSSTQYQRGAFLVERVGPTTFVFACEATAETLKLRLARFRALGIPLPRFMHPLVQTCESERDGRYHFEVEAHLPLFGLLVRYSGWLEPRRAQSCRAQ